MPRIVKRRNQSLKRRLLTFSPFARLIAMATVIQRARHEHIVAYRGNGFISHDEIRTPLSESSDNEQFDGVVRVDYFCCVPEPSDFDGVKLLLQTYLDDIEWDLSGFVDSILGQPTVGSVVKVENSEEEAVYSVVTALNLDRYKDRECMLELKDYLLKVCRDMNVMAKLKSLVVEHGQDVGLLVSRRVVNLATQLLPPLYDDLFRDVQRATVHEPTGELRRSFRFKYYLIISKIYKHKNANQNRGDGEEAVMYANPEDEIFFELCSWSFSFPLHTQQVMSHERRNYRPMGLVMAVESTKIPSFREQLHSLINE